MSVISNLEIEPRSHFPRRILSLDEILSLLGTSCRQWGVVAAASFLYAHFSVQSMQPSLATVSVWETWSFLSEQKVRYNTIMSVSAIARFVGSIIFIPLLDRWGRFPVLLVFLLSSFVTAIASFASPNFTTYVTLRALVALFVAILPSGGTVYAVEFLQPNRRAIPAITCQFIACLSVSYAAGMNMVIGNSSIELGKQWRYCVLLFLAPGVIALLIMLWLRLESPRFQVAVKNSPSSAWETFSKMVGGKTELEKKLMRGLAEQEEESLPLSAYKIEQTQDISDTANMTFFRGIIYSISQMRYVFSPEYLRTTLVLIVIWVLQSFCHWGLSSYMTVFFAYIGVNSNATTLGSFLCQIPGQALIYFIMENERYGGRIVAIKTFSVATAIVQLTLAIMLLCNVTNVGVLTTFSILCFVFGAPLWGPIYGYTAELYPTEIRGAAVGFFSAANALSIVATTYVGSVSLDETRKWLFPLIWGLLRLLLAIVAIFCTRETRSVGLEDHRGELQMTTKRRQSTEFNEEIRDEAKSQNV